MTPCACQVFRAIGLLKRLCNHPLLLLCAPQQLSLCLSARQMPKVKDWAGLLKEARLSLAPDASVEVQSEGTELSEAELTEQDEVSAASDVQREEAEEVAPAADVEEMLRKLRLVLKTIISKVHISYIICYY